MRANMPFLFCFGLTTVAAQASEIHDAAKKGDLAAIAALLEAGADVNDTDGVASPLTYALIKSHPEAAKLLVAHGADVNAASKMGGSPLMIAVTKGQPGMVELLLANGADPNMAPGKQSPIHAAAKQGCLDCVIALVKAGAEVNARTSDGFARTPLHIARSNEDAAMADYLLAHGVVVPEPEAIDQALRKADPDRGSEIFGRYCDGCHSTEQGGGTKEGPNLWGVVGREKGSLPDFRYSATMQNLEGVWTFADLNSYLYDPILTTPGVRMEVPGISDPGERADLIAYLRSLSSEPLPFP
jgi:cytochrome c